MISGSAVTAAQRGGSTLQPAMREHGLDWLRVIAFAILIFYHCGMMFVSWGWHIRNAERSWELELVMLFFNRWRLPLLFFISGAGVAFSLRRRGFGEFAGERILRLFVPLAFGMLVVVPPQIYVERVSNGVQYASYFAFWRTVLEFRSYPAGNTSWHHLWFVAYVLVYALAGIPIFAFLRSTPGRKILGAFADAMEHWWPVAYLVNVPNIVVGLTLGPRWPTTHNLTSDWANLTGAFLTFLWGFIIASDHRLLDTITRRRREFLAVWMVLLVLFYVVLIGRLRSQMPNLAWELVNAYLGMAAIFTLLGYSRALLNFTNRWLRYATEAVYPFYILHQTVIVCIGYFIIRWRVPLLVKLAAAVVGCFAITWALHEAIRRVSPLRPLFGLRLQSRIPV